MAGKLKYTGKNPLLPDVNFTTSHHPIFRERCVRGKQGASFIYSNLIAIVDQLTASKVSVIGITANNAHNCQLDIYKVGGKRHKKRMKLIITAK